MQNPAKCENWRAYAWVSVVVLAAPTLAAIATKLWVLTAIPVGLLFGFLLQKGDLCGASAFSEVILMKDWRKVWGYWVWIVTGMVGFAVLDLLGWVTLNPKPMLWVSYVVGGLIFGIGTVLAGGCVSGCLFKTGIGHLTTMAALPGIALGVAAVEHGPLKSLYVYMKGHVIKASDGGSVTLSSATGLPFWVLAAAFAVITFVPGLVVSRKKRAARAGEDSDRSSWSRVLTARNWRPWQGGIALGILGALAYLSSAASGRNYPLGVTHGVLHAQLLITDTNLKHVWEKTPPPKSAPPAAAAKVVGKEATSTVQHPPQKKVSWWLIAEVISLVVGSCVAAKMSGEARLYPKPPEQIVIAFFGGLLVGCGAAFARGCFIGNMTSGWALMSIGTVVFGVVAILANWITTYFYLMGGTLFGSDE